MKKKGFTLVELVAVLVLIAVLGIIIYPRVSNIVEENKKKAFMESVKSTIRSYDTYLASENYPDLGEVDITSGIIPTVEASNWKSGVIEKFGDDIYVENFYDGNFCAFGYENSLVFTRGECKKTPNTCFSFDENTKTITGYKLGGSCTKTVIIPDVIKGVNVEAIGNSAFFNKGLEYVTMPTSITTIGEYAFASNKLETITIPNNVVIIGRGAFNNNLLPDQQAFIYKKKADKTYDTSALVSYGGKRRSNIVVPETVKIIGDSAFRYNNITSITLPSELEEIHNQAFIYNYLTEIELPATLKVIQAHGFASNQIKEVSIPNGLTTLGNYAFERNGLQEVSIPNTITSLGTHTFYYNNLEEVTIPTNWTSIPTGTFQQNKLVSVTLPANIKSIDTYAFYNNPTMTSVNLGSVQTIGTYAFRYCPIQTLNIPSTTISIGDYARTGSAPRETTRARFQSGLKHVGDTTDGNTDDASDFASRSRFRYSTMSRRWVVPTTRHVVFARLSRQNHSPQSQPTQSSPSSTPSTSSSSASRPNTTSTLLFTAASRSIVSVHLLSVAAPVENTTFVSTSASGRTASGSDDTTTLAPAKAERARNATIKIAAPNFM